MANCFFLNGMTKSASLMVNGGNSVSLKNFSSSSGNTAKYGLASSPNVDVIGLGKNELRITIDSVTYIWKLELTSQVNIALDVQVVIFENQLQPKNTVSTQGFVITLEGRSGQAMVQSAVIPLAKTADKAKQAIAGVDLTFSLSAQNQTAGLYTASSNSGAGNGVAYLDYYLYLETGQTPPEVLTLDESFNNRGAYIFSNEAVDPATLLSELELVLVNQTEKFTRLAWRLGAGAYEKLQVSTVSAVAEDAIFPIGTWQLLFRPRAILGLRDDAPVLAFSNQPGEQSIEVQVKKNTIAQPAGSEPSEVFLPLTGNHGGAMILDWDWDHYALGQDFGGNQRVFYGASAESAQYAQYPLFTPAPDPGPRPTLNLFFNVYMQPLARLDDTRTRMALDLEKPNALESRYLASTTNAPVQLAPAATEGQELAAGFGFAKNTGLEESDRYLCPVGRFQVGTSTLANATTSRVQIRGGIGGTEFVMVEPGDVLSFSSAEPAFAKDYNPEDGVPTKLTTDLTTSWLDVVRKQGLAASGDGELVDTSYCAQSSASTYFGTQLDPNYAFPIAVGASLVQFVMPADEVPFPMVPYGGVFYSDSEQGIENPNPNLSATALSNIEQQLIAPLRRSKLEPLFDKKYGPIFFDTSTNLGLNGGYAKTPLGLLAELNKVTTGEPPAGSIQRIILALSPQIPGQTLSLEPNTASSAYGKGVVNPTFSNTTLNDNLFLVATDPVAFEPLANQIKLGDFTFEVDLGNDANEAISVFKFLPGVTTRALINDTNAWTSLIGQATTSQVQVRLQELLKIADEGGDLFASFRQMIDNPNWNGLLIFNCPLNYQELPLDIQILLGGIKGQLRAHHFGVTINRVNDAEGKVEHSSLFSVIHYQEAFVPPSTFPDFQVLLLNVRYANSKLAVFDSQIAYSIQTLYGTPVELVVAPPTDFKNTGTLVIDGVYTLNEDGTGSLVFATKDQRSFKFNPPQGKFSAITYQSVTNAALVPINQEGASGECTQVANSAFRLDGILAFDASIGGDLFSYGNVVDQVVKEGLVVLGYAFIMQTCIKADNTAYIIGAIATTLDSLSVDQAFSKARKESLEQTFPSLIQALTYDPYGLKPIETGEWQVSKATFSGAPVYSLKFDVPMGTLGKLLSSQTDLTMELFVGWDPNTTDSKKQVGVILRLPPEVAGASGFDFQGILPCSFQRVDLDQITLSSSTGGEDTKVYVLYFVHYQGMLLSMLFNYSSGPKDLGFFGGPSNPGGSNAMYFVGTSIDDNWNGPTLSVTFEGVPSVFLGRSYEIKTDPTNPNVIQDVFDALNPLTDKSVEQFINIIYANQSLYNSDAGIVFALQFTFKSVNFTTVLHDSSFYGAQLVIEPEEKEEGGGTNGGGNGNGKPARSLAPVAGKALAEKKSGGFLEQIKNFSFTVIYRKVSDSVGVWSADIYLDLGQINLGIFQLSLPNFSISIWTNGDWRFAIGWPFNGDNDDAHPITVQFQAGPVPIIAKAGFYLAKLSSAAAPAQFGDEFNLIWSFGAGLAGGVGKRYESGPLEAEASLILYLTFEGFLASFTGKMTEDGVDYWWWGISLTLTGKLEGKVDFEIIEVSVSLSVSVQLAFAIETAHKSLVTMNVRVKAKASVKILFVRISFSFSTKLDLFTFTFGSGPKTSLSGPSPTDVMLPNPAARMAVGGLAGMLRQAYQSMRDERIAASGPAYVRTAASPEPIATNFLLQSTSISPDGRTWNPQGVGTLILESGDATSPFGKVANLLAPWLIATYGSGATFYEQLESTELALQQGAFDAQVNQALAELFVFNISGAAFAEDAQVVSLAIHPSLGITYNGAPVEISLDGCLRSHCGAQKLPQNYFDMVAAYFKGQPIPNARVEGEMSTAEKLFNEYFVMLAQQLIQLLIETAAPDLESALAALSLSDLGGFVSRFLNGGLRLPDPNNPEQLEAVTLLTGQQFALVKKDDAWVLDAGLVPTASTPSWITVADGTKASLTKDMVHTTGPAAPPWTLSQLQALAKRALTYPLNNNNVIDRSDGTDRIITTLSDTLLQGIRNYRKKYAVDNGPWLSLFLQGTDEEGDGQANLSTAGTAWNAVAALSMSIQLAAIPDPSGDPGVFLPNIFSLLGTDEVDRAALQALLEDVDAGKVSLQAVELFGSESRGNWKVTKIPDVLVRADLSTDSAPAQVATMAVAEVADATTDCANYAKLGEGGAELSRFLRLVWEVSIIHSDGFYLQVEGLDLSDFDAGPVDFMLLATFGTEGSILAAQPYQNALIGQPPQGDVGIFATLAKDDKGTAVEAYGAAYPGGEVGWNIVWNNAPDVADAAADGYLQGLYQMISYRVTAVNGGPITRPWSRPQSAQDDSAEGAADTVWNYQQAFPTADLVGDSNRYAAVNDTFTVVISLEDVFGNTLPENLQPSVNVNVVYNDNILGLGDWAGTETYYLITSENGVNLQLQFTLDASVVQDSEGKVDPEQLATAYATYLQVKDQLTDKNMSGAVSTGKILTSSPIQSLTSGESLLSGLVSYISSVVSWLANGGTGAAPEPTVLSMTLDKTYPTQWTGDLQELVISLVLTRADVLDEIAAKVPLVREVISPVQPVSDTGEKDDPSGLTTFANHFETAYYPFDGDQGVVKVATGTNNDLSSMRFGNRSIWLQRWSESKGTAVTFPSDVKPVFYAPPPLSRQLITRNVKGLRNYTNPGEWTPTSMVFTSIDMDLWGASFLTAVETIFSPQKSTATAIYSTRESELYNPFVDNKESLAGTISDSIQYVYDEPQGTGNPSSAKETWRQALLRTLNNDYGFSTLTQLLAKVKLNGPIEPNGDPGNPPRLFGAVQVPGTQTTDKLPYSLTPTTLPLVAGDNWLNFLTSARDPAEQRAFTLNLDYEVNQLEHNRDGNASACGFTPSDWLTFVLQQNPQGLPQGQNNTLTQPIGETRIPIPLRSYPPLPKILRAEATQQESITTIEQALTWNFNLVVERSSADQDTLNLSLSFNELQPDEQVMAKQAFLATGRDLPSDLFDALGRWAFEYPQLLPYINSIETGSPDAIQAIMDFNDLVIGVAETWPKWVAPNPQRGGFAKATKDGSLEVWHFAIQDVENSENLEITATWTRGSDAPPWPVIQGYSQGSVTDNKAIYKPDGGQSLQTLAMAWENLYILDYQNFRPSAYTERNRNLAVPPDETNPNFIYRTETISWPTPIVPLVTVEDLLPLPSESSLQAALENFLVQLTTPPPGSVTNGSNPVLALETAISYRYEVMANLNTATFTLFPVFLLDSQVDSGDENAEATKIATNLSNWHTQTGASSPQSSLALKPTVFATTIVVAGDLLPLVQFTGLVIDIPNDNPGWW